MKKRNLLAILATLSVILIAFTACGDKKENGKEDESKGKESSSAVVEETTEKSVEDSGTADVPEADTTGVPATDANGETVPGFIQVIVPVTDAAGEVVTDAQGETKVEIVTKPAPTKPSTNSNATTAPGATKPGATKPGTTKPGATDSNKPGTTLPANLKLTKLADQFKGQKSLAFECEMSVDGQDVTMKMYMKDDKVSMEAKMGLMSMRVIYADNTAKMIIPMLKAYVTMPADSMGAMDMSELTSLLDDIIGSEDIEYISTTNEKVDGKSYVCETYKSGSTTSKYYFDKKDNLKRIVNIDSRGNEEVVKVNEFSTKVSDSVFKVPAGYKEMSEDDIGSLIGGF